MTYTVSKLFYHPIKSLAAVQSQAMSVGPTGPILDRRLMLVDSMGVFVTQRTFPQMVKFLLWDNGRSLTLQYDQSIIEFNWPDFSIKTESILVDVWGDKIFAQLFEPAVSQWVSNHLGESVRLVYMDNEEHRQVDLTYTDKGVGTAFADGFPFLLLSQASVDFLSDKVGFQLDVSRFRPNILVAGCEPFEEDSWRKIKIGDIEFDLVKPCSRCVIPTINLKTAEKERAVLQAMLDFRKKDGEVYVGQNLVHKNLGLLKQGDELLVLE